MSFNEDDFRFNTREKKSKKKDVAAPRFAEEFPMGTWVRWSSPPRPFYLGELVPGCVAQVTSPTRGGIFVAFRHEGRRYHLEIAPGQPCEKAEAPED